MAKFLLPACSVFIMFIVLSYIYTISIQTSPLLSLLQLLFSSSIDRNYMFLLCNGILVILVKSSGLMNIGVAAQGDHGRDDQREQTVVTKAEEPQKTVDGSAGSLAVGGDGARENDIRVLIEEDISETHHEHHEDDDDDVGLMMMSTEELNKKCDDFITKMKKQLSV